MVREIGQSYIEVIVEGRYWNDLWVLWTGRQLGIAQTERSTFADLCVFGCSWYSSLASIHIHTSMGYYLIEVTCMGIVVCMCVHLRAVT